MFCATAAGNPAFSLKGACRVNVTMLKQPAHSHPDRETASS
ncbi:Hypothetical protein NGAL_HAMBI490_31510 [Neorhizobium galegae bv. officinalis]|nr:Hypothetical protein NGAL_HAMBI490_31510 [Neorhizobium galegae bv. officinalis]